MPVTDVMSIPVEQIGLGKLLKKNPGVQFLVAVSGAVICWRLSNPRWVHLPAPAPASFGDRLRLAGPPLLGLVLCMFFVAWAALLFNAWTNSTEPRMAKGAAAQSATKTKPPRILMLLLFGCSMLAMTLSISVHYLQFLWPAQAKAISSASHLVLLIATGAGFLVENLNRRRKKAQQASTAMDAEKETSLNRRRVQFFAALLLTAPVLIWILRKMQHASPSHGDLLVRTVIILYTAGLMVFFMIPARKRDGGAPRLDAERLGTFGGDGRVRKKPVSKEVVPLVIGTLMGIVLFLPVHGELKLALFFAPIALLVMHAGWLSSVKRRILRLTQQGDYDEALQVDKQYSWIPGYGTPLQGTVLFGAGRYAEAQALLKPLAFDANGQPLLTGTAYYTYALALVNDGRAAEAQVLLDAAVRVPQRDGGFHVALATCLLSQDKDAERARELLEQAMSEWPVKSDRYEARADQMRRFGRYAWALAACGRREEAQAKLQEALDGATGFRSGDMAGLQYFAGETWRVLGETEKARAAFKEAMRLSPTGVSFMSAKKGLAKLVE